MSDDGERKANREKLVEWFLANPGASVDASLKVATREKRALGLTMGIATLMKRDASVIQQRRAELVKVALESSVKAPKLCTRCKSTEHWVSECPVVVELPPAPPPPLPKFEFEGDRDDEAIWVHAGQFLFEQMASGLALVTPQVHEVVGGLGPKRFWVEAMQRLNGRVFEMTAQAEGPGSANLWACRRDREDALLEIAASEELTAGVLWSGPETARVNKLLEEEKTVAVIPEGVPTVQQVKPPANTTSNTTPTAPAAGLLPTLLNIQKLCAASVQGQGLLKTEIDKLRAEIGDVKTLTAKLDTLIALLQGQS